MAIQLGQHEQIKFDMTQGIVKVTLKALTLFVGIVVKSFEKVLYGTFLLIMAFLYSVTIDIWVFAF